METLQNGVRAAIKEKLSCMSYSSNLWDVKNGQNNLLTGLKAALFSKPLLVMTTELIKTFFRINIPTLVYLTYRNSFLSLLIPIDIPSAQVIIPAPFS